MALFDNFEIVPPSYVDPYTFADNNDYKNQPEAIRKQILATATKDALEESERLAGPVPAAHPNSNAMRAYNNRKARIESARDKAIAEAFPNIEGYTAGAKAGDFLVAAKQSAAGMLEGALTLGGYKGEWRQDLAAYSEKQEKLKSAEGKRIAANSQRRSESVQDLPGVAGAYEGLKAGFQNFADNPYVGVGGAAGSATALLPALLAAPFGPVPAAAVGATTFGLSALGATKKERGDAVYRAAKANNYTEEAALSLGAKAAETDEKTFARDAASLFIGGVQGATGLAGAVRNATTKVAAGAAKQNAFKAGGKTLAEELGTETLQVANDTSGANVRATEFGFDTPTWRGVATNVGESLPAAAAMSGPIGVASQVYTNARIDKLPDFTKLDTEAFNASMKDAPTAKAPRQQIANKVSEAIASGKILDPNSQAGKIQANYLAAVKAKGTQNDDTGTGSRALDGTTEGLQATEYDGADGSTTVLSDLLRQADGIERGEQPASPTTSIFETAAARVDGRSVDSSDGGIANQSQQSVTATGGASETTATGQQRQRNTLAATDTDATATGGSAQIQGNVSLEEFAKYIPNETQAAANLRIKQAVDAGFTIDEVAQAQADSYKANQNPDADTVKFAAQTKAAYIGNDFIRPTAAQIQAVTENGKPAFTESESQMLAGNRMGLSEPIWDKAVTELRKKYESITGKSALTGANNGETKEALAVPVTGSASIRATDSVGSLDGQAGQVNANPPIIDNAAVPTSGSPTVPRGVSVPDTNLQSNAGGSPTVQTSTANVQPKAKADLAPIPATAPEIRAEQKKAAKKAAKKRLQAAANALAPYDKQSPFLGWLMRNGIKRSEQGEWKDFKPSSIATGPLFRKKGYPLDLLHAKAIEDGYLSQDSSVDDLYKLISRQASGARIDPLYTEDGATNAVAEAVERQRAEYEDYLAVANEPSSTILTDLDFITDDLEVSGYNDLSRESQARIQALLATANSLGVDADLILENVQYETTGKPDELYYAEAIKQLTEVVATGNASSSQNVSEQSQSPRQAEPEVLVLQPTTPETNRAQQRQRDAESQRREQGGDAPLPTRKVTADTPDMFNTQGSVFDVPAEVIIQDEGKDKAPTSNDSKLSKVEQKDNEGGFLETTSSRATQGFTDAFGGGVADIPSAINAAQAITPLIGKIKVVKAELPIGTLARYDRTNGIIEISGKYQWEQDRLIEALVEERLHALDSISPSKTISQNTAAFLPNGEVYLAAEKQVRELEVFGEFLTYPINYKNLSDNRVAAELFARIGVLFASNPRAAALAFPNLKDVYDIRPTENFAIDERIRDQVPEPSGVGRGASQNSSQQRLDDLTVSIFGKVGQAIESADRIRTARSRQRIAQALNADIPELNKKPQQSQSPTTRNPSNPTAIRTAIEGIFSGIKDAWARVSKHTVVVNSVADLPQFAEAIGTTGQAFFVPSKVKGEQGKIYLIADRIEKGQEASVWLHEVFHKRGEELLGKENLKKLYDNVQSWKKRPEGSVERQIYEAANKRASKSGDYDTEFLTYAIEEASNRGVTPDASKGATTAAGWLAKVKALFTSALRKLLSGYAGKIDISANELMAMAYGAAKLEYEGKTDSNRQIIRVDEHGKNIVYEKGGYSIAVNSIDDASRISLWKDGKNVGNLNLGKGRTADTKGYKTVSSVEVDMPHRNKGMSTEMYRAALKFIGDEYKGIGGENEQRSNTKQVPAIYKKLGGIQHQSGDFTIDKSAGAQDDGVVATSNLQFSRASSIDETLEIIKTGKLPDDKRSYSEIKDSIVTNFTDSTRPHDVWTRDLPDQGEAATLIQAKNLASGRESAFNKEVMDNFGSRISMAIGAIHKANKDIDFGAAQRLAGDWMSAIYAPIANQNLLRKDVQALQEAVDAAKLDASPSNKAAVTRAKKTVLERQAAITDKRVIDPSKQKLDIGLAGGYNDATAKQMTTYIEERIDKELLQNVADIVYEMNAWKLQKDIELGKVTKEMAEQFDKSGKYVPLTGDPRADDTAADVFGTGSVNQGKNKSLKGRTSGIAQNGIDASFEQVQKTARYHGWADYKDALHGMYERSIEKYLADGSTQQEAQKKTTEDLGISRSPETMQRPSDDVIIYRKNGEAWVYDIGNKAAIDALRSANVEPIPTAYRHVALATRSMARLVTQFMPGFAPVNALRDTWEKSENIRTRVTPNYPDMDMNKVARSMLGNSLKSLTTLHKTIMPVVAQGTPVEAISKLDPNNADQKLMMQFLSDGGASTWGQFLSTDGKDLAEKLGKMHKLPAKAVDTLDVWNNSWELISSFSVYKALRENGMDSKAASNMALELMNFRKGGELMKPIKALYMFAQPIATGGQQLLKTLDTRRGKVRFAAYAAAGFLLYGMLRSGEDDDELGVNRMDNRPNYEIERNIIIPYGDAGKSIAIPIGFGLPMLAWTYAVNTAKLILGKQTAAETAIELIVKTPIKTFAPVAPSESSISKNPFAWMVQTVTPTLGKPIANVALDRTAFGGSLTSSRFEKPDKANALEGRLNTPEFYKDAAKELANVGLDTYPEVVREIIHGYFIGALNVVVKAAIDNPAKEARGKEPVSQFIDRWVKNQDRDDLKQRLYYRYREELNDVGVRASLGKTLDDKQTAMLKILEETKKDETSVRTSKAQATKKFGNGKNPAIYEAELKRVDTKQSDIQVKLIKKMNELDEK